MTLDELRMVEDNKHIDNSIMSDESSKVFDDWKVRDSAEYRSSYLKMLAEIYDVEDSYGDTEAEEFSKSELQDWIEIYFTRENPNDSLIGKIHACNDWLNGEDVFGENYA